MENKKNAEIPPSDYDSNHDKTREYLKDIYKKENNWKRELKERLNSKVPTYGHHPENSVTSGNPLRASGTTGTTVTKLTNNYISSPVIAKSVVNSAITINGDPVNGSVTIDVPLKVNGRDIMKELDEMRDALLLLKRDVDMEAKYPRLKEIKDEYEQTLEKYKTFEALK